MLGVANEDEVGTADVVIVLLAIEVPVAVDTSPFLPLSLETTMLYNNSSNYKGQRHKSYDLNSGLRKLCASSVSGRIWSGFRRYLNCSACLST